MSSVIITCEHAVNTIPDQFTYLFRGADDVLASHRGIDKGALSLAEHLAQKFSVPLYLGEVSRLLIELNRSIGHHQFFSSFTKGLSQQEKQKLIDAYYLPYRHAVENWISNAGKPVIHFSIHSFTPVFDEIIRSVDIGLLFDPDRVSESLYCKLLSEQLQNMLPEKVVEFNEPYLGVDDGFTTYLRSRFRDEAYAGIEIEVNQKYVGTPDFNLIQSALIHAIENIIAT